jgi:hypothetical protein
MTKFFVAVILIQWIAFFVLIVMNKILVSRAKKAEQEATIWRQAFSEAEEGARRIRKALVANGQVEVKANEKRQEVNSAPDNELATRANTLFGMRNGGERSE